MNTRPVPIPRLASPIDEAERIEARRRRWSLRIARIAGIEVRVHVTFALLVGLIAWSNAALGDPVLPALGWLGALFACIVVHELAHSVVARRLGVPVREIDLLPIGGMSRLERLPARWQDEVRIAVAGPAASVALALIAGSAALLLDGTVGRPDALGGPLLSRLLWVNLLLAAFNLLPAFPMDGGRVVRAWRQRRLGRVEATRAAVRSSRYLAWGFVVGGLLLDVWLTLIGLFVLVGGRAELASVEVHELLDARTIGRVVRPCPIHLPAGMAPEPASALAAEHRQVAYPVIDHSGALLGVVTQRDLGPGPGGTVGRRCRPVAVLTPGASVGDALDASAGATVVVLDGAAVVGVVDPAALRSEVDQAWRQVR